MGYAVKEIFYTLQGEGANAGRPAVFCRFTGCNLWSGRPQDRDRGPGACSRWCDTDFVGTNGPGGGRFEHPEALALAVRDAWVAPWQGRPLVVCTGGEPLLQLDEALIAALHRAGFEIAVETNGTILAPPGIDWLCVSPKANSELLLRSGDELKLIFPQPGAEPERFEGLDFRHFFLQPLADPSGVDHTPAALRYCLEHPRWRLGLQTHKILAIP
ncbi:MAG: 7-carboxy-7-deazaguanine synthase [Polyangiaceae bacterium]|jgi:7-carboxy-7-deazaguanine synthase (Cx14CxxC type)|nr:7-carboxy-7-deazaguanine synthase [Polyangiaceae bacterium]